MVTRWMATFAIAACLHVLAMLLIKLPPSEAVAVSVPVAIKLDAYFDPEENAGASSSERKTHESQRSLDVASADAENALAEKTEPAKAAHAVETIAEPERPQPEMESKPVAEPLREEKQLEEERKVAKTVELAPLSRPTVAFDESKSKGAPDDSAYMSDRNSSAADRGPKDLPRGDPYMDKGESGAIRYNEKRGEGQMPAIPSDPRAGSVQKEGVPNPGLGEKTLITREPEKLAAPQNESKETRSSAAADAAEPRQAPIETPRGMRGDSEVNAREILAETKRVGQAIGENGTEAAGNASQDITGQREANKRGTPDKPERVVAQQVQPQTPHGQNSETLLAQKQPSELEAFAALLESPRPKGGKSGDTGTGRRTTL